MKNLNIKQVALGLFLAGYATSSAFAVSAVSSSTITGRAPIVNSITLSNPSDSNSVSVTVYKDANLSTVVGTNDFWEVGNVVRLSYNLVDKDGDAEVNKETANSIKFGYIVNGAWTWVAPNSNTANGEVTWTIPDEATGSSLLAYMIRPTTQYGAPIANNWIIGYLNGGQAPTTGGDGVGPDGKPKDPDTTTVITNLPPTTNPTDLPNGPGTGSDPVPGTGPIKPNPNSLTLLIHKATLSGGQITIGDALGSEAPIVGNTYAVQAKSQNNDVTALYSYTWSLVENNPTAIGSTGAAEANVDGLTAVTATINNQSIVNVAYTIPVNRELKAMNSASGTEESVTRLAGAQGYKLQVSTN